MNRILVFFAALVLASGCSPQGQDPGKSMFCDNPMCLLMFCPIKSHYRSTQKVEQNRVQVVYQQPQQPPPHIIYQQAPQPQAHEQPPIQYTQPQVPQPTYQPPAHTQPPQRHTPRPTYVPPVPQERTCDACGGRGSYVCPACQGRCYSGTCTVCKGTGAVWFKGVNHGCTACNSTGKQKCTRCLYIDVPQGTIRCPRCNGTGKIR